MLLAPSERAYAAAAMAIGDLRDRGGMLCPVSLGEERSRATLARVPRGTDSRGEAEFHMEPTPGVEAMFHVERS